MVVDGMQGVTMQGDGHNVVMIEEITAPLGGELLAATTSEASQGEYVDSSSGTCTPQTMDRTNMCAPKYCDMEGSWQEVPLDCNYGITPCSCCDSCSNLGIYLKGDTSTLLGNPTAGATFLAECSAKLHPIRCIALSPQWLTKGVVHLEMQGTQLQLNEADRVLRQNPFTLPSFPTSYTLITRENNRPSRPSHPSSPTGPSYPNSNGPSGTPAPPRNNMMRPRNCDFLPRNQCFGMAMSGGSEPAMCGWSPSGMCGLVKITGEPKEGDACFMKHTFQQCSGMANMGSGDRVCVWNPMMRTCVSGELDQEPEGNMPPMPFNLPPNFNINNLFDGTTNFRNVFGPQPQLRKTHEESKPSFETSRPEESSSWRCVGFGAVSLFIGFTTTIFLMK